MILMICHGNRYRSPFAHGLLAHLRPDLSVSSAGVKQPIGSHPAARPTRVAAARLGIDLTEHRAVGLTQDMLDKAALVLYMDGGNLKRLRSGWEVEEGKLRCLASYAGQARVPDPCFLPNHAKGPVWDLIDRACRQLSKELS